MWGARHTAATKRDVAASFSRAAAHYDSAAQLQRDVGCRLLDNARQVDAPRRILDLGCGTGYFQPHLAELYPEAEYIGLDIASGMVEFRPGALRRRQPVAGGRCRKPCHWPAGRWDLVFSSLAIQWCHNPRALLAELGRVLAPGGRCVFTTLGPQTLVELRDAWAEVDAHQHVNTFLPAEALHGAADSVPGLSLSIERELFVMRYERVRELLDELKAIGAHNMNRGRQAGLTGRRALQGMLAAYETRRDNGLLPATYDVQFGCLERL